MNLQQLTLKVQQLAQQMQQTHDLAKKISELPLQDNLDPNSLIHVSKNGVSESLELQKIIDAIINYNYDRLVSVGLITLTGEVLNIPALVEWVIGQVNYIKPDETNLAIPLSSSGKIRIDFILGNTLGEVYRYAGPENEGVAIRQSVPPQTVLITELIVTDSGISVSEPITGSEFITKISQGIINYPENNATFGIPFDYSVGKTKYRLTNPTVYDVPGISSFTNDLGANNIIEGTIFHFLNEGANHLYKHDAIGNTVVVFKNPNNQDFLAVKGSVITYIYSNSELIFQNYSLGGLGISTIDEVLTAGSTAIDKTLTITRSNVALNAINTNAVLRTTGNIFGSYIYAAVLNGPVSLGSNSTDFARTTGGGAAGRIRTNRALVYEGVDGINVPITFSGREIADVNFNNATYAKLIGQNILKKDNNANTSTSAIIVEGVTNPNLNLRLNLDTTNNLAEIQAINAGVTYLRLFLQQEGGDVVIGQDISGTEKLRVGGSSRFHGDVNLTASLYLGKFTNGTEPAYEAGKTYYNLIIGKMKIGGSAGWEIITSS